jgi:transposase-like protein
VTDEAYQPATVASPCPRCSSTLNQNRHYPGEGNRYYCPRCDEEWWTDRSGHPLDEGEQTAERVDSPVVQAVTELIAGD